MTTLVNRKILVTGGAGYAGSILVRRLLELGAYVVCIDNLNFGGRSLLDVWGHPNFEFHKVDITDFNATNAFIIDHELFAIVHLAAIVGDPACKREPDLARRTNLEASLNLINTARKFGVERFIFASTCSNYGKMRADEDFLNELSPLNPVSLYAELKVAVEDYLLNQIEKTKGFAPTALRFSTIYGVSPRMRFDLTVNEFTKDLALGKKLVVFGEQFWRPYCYVGDFARAIIAVLTASEDKVAYSVFNVGDSSQNYTKKMIVDELVKLIPDAMVEFVHREEDPRDYRVDFSKIQRELGFSISKTVPAGIADILSALQMNIIEDPADQRYYNIPI